ncbi:uncharacterized protein [Periplaneta americana]|uniref:uncharacterized protein n=1 Tax=Periplaneta americana TaxID=6978 RepID=UPI0037E83B45
MDVSSNSASSYDRERTSLRVVLSGLGLGKEEIERFEDENIGLETLASLSDDDLIGLGVKDLEKRKEIIKLVLNLKTRGTNKQHSIVKLEPLRWKDGLEVVTNNLQHVDLLHGVLQYIRSQQRIHRTKFHVVDGFLDNEWSCSAALLACAATVLTQTQETCRQLELLKMSIAGRNNTTNERTNQRARTKKLAVILLTSVLITGFVLWRNDNLHWTK